MTSTIVGSISMPMMWVALAELALLSALAVWYLYRRQTVVEYFETMGAESAGE